MSRWTLRRGPKCGEIELPDVAVWILGGTEGFLQRFWTPLNQRAVSRTDILSREGLCGMLRDRNRIVGRGDSVDTIYARSRKGAACPPPPQQEISNESP